MCYIFTVVLALDPRNVIPSTTHNDSTRRYYKPQFEAIADRLMTLNRGSPMYTKFVDEMKENAKKQLEVSRSRDLFNDCILSTASSLIMPCTYGCKRTREKRQRLNRIRLHSEKLGMMR